MLTPDRLRRIEGLFNEALDQPPDGRVAWLDAQCAGDAELRRHVAALLAADAEAGDEASAIAANVASRWAADHRRHAPLVGQDVGGFHVLSLIGSGGMGEVYLAEDAALDRRVALKLLLDEFTHDERRLRRFTDEAHAVSALNHPNILTILRVGDHQGRRFIVTEFVDGETLRDQLARGPLPPAVALDVARQVAAALGAAHGAGIIHRDIKPDNIMIRRDGYVKVLDFGIAKLAIAEGGTDSQPRPLRTMTREGAVVGTVHYMAPEQAMGEKVDARANLYSLAVVLREMVTGTSPGDNRHESSGRRASSLDQARDRQAGQIRQILRRGLAREPSARYQTAHEMERDLAAAGAGTGRARSSWIAIAATVAVAVLGALGLYRWRTASAATHAVTSLLVMPLDALSADQAHLEAGMSNAIITRLGAVRELRVPPSSAVRANEDPFEAARRLGVDAVLTGSVQRASDRLRVTAQLSRTADHTQIWAAHFDENFTDIFSVQDAIAERIAANLVPSLSSAESAALKRREADNSDDYDLYLRARSQWALRSPESVRTAIAMYQRAIATEPNFALAYAGLADAYAITASGMVPRVRFPLAKAAALKAIALDPNLAQAHTALAFLTYKSEWNWDKAEAEFQRAVALDPRYALARHWHGEFLGLRGQFDEGIAELKEATLLDPYSPAIRADYAVILIKGGRLAEAEAVIDAGIKIDASEWRMYSAQSWLNVAAGRPDAAVESDLKMRTLAHDPEPEVAALRDAARRGGRPMFLRQLIAGVKARMANAPIAPYGLASTLATAYAELNDRDNTLAWLTMATDRGEDAPLIAKTMPVYKFLRGDPAFEALLKRVGLGEP